MYEIKAYQDKMKDKFVSNLIGLFPNSEKRISVWAEVDKYKHEDEGIWNQAKGRTAPQYEVHFDGEFVCFIDGQKSDRYNLSEFLSNIKKLYLEKKIYVNVEMYAVKQAEQEALDTKPDLLVPAPSNEAEATIVEVVKKQAKKRKRKVKLVNAKS
jgi:hypothetical protein